MCATLSKAAGDPYQTVAAIPSCLAMQTIESISSSPDQQALDSRPQLPLPHRFEGVTDAGVVIAVDDAKVVAMTDAYLRSNGFKRIWSTDSTPDAPRIAARVDPSLILLGIHNPDRFGLAVLQSIRAHPATAATPIVAMVGDLKSEEKFYVLRNGATDLLTLPLHESELVSRVRNVATSKIYQDQLSKYSRNLENAVQERTAELELARLELMRCMARAAELRDDDTGNHVIRVGKYARIIGSELDLSQKALDVLELAAQLHDIGKIGIPDHVLLKPGKLSNGERTIIRKHCSFGKRILEGKSLRELNERETVALRAKTAMVSKVVDIGQSPILSVAKRVALTHHERWDGTGYPLGLSGTDIPLEGRITAVADVFDALSTARHYKPAYPFDRCFQILEEGRGCRFDPAVVDAFLVRRDEVIQVRIDCADTE